MSDALTNAGKQLSQTYHVGVASDTQKIPSFDWAKCLYVISSFCQAKHHFRWSNK